MLSPDLSLCHLFEHSVAKLIEVAVGDVAEFLVEPAVRLCPGRQLPRLVPLDAVVNQLGSGLLLPRLVLNLAVGILNFDFKGLGKLLLLLTVFKFVSGRVWILDAPGGATYPPKPKL